MSKNLFLVCSHSSSPTSAPEIEEQMFLIFNSLSPREHGQWSEIRGVVIQNFKGHLCSIQALLLFLPGHNYLSAPFTSQTIHCLVISLIGASGVIEKSTVFSPSLWIVDSLTCTLRILNLASLKVAYWTYHFPNKQNWHSTILLQQIGGVPSYSLLFILWLRALSAKKAPL